MPEESEEDVARSVSEDRRLVSLGIDPDCSPADRMDALDRKKEELKRRIENGEGD